MEENQPSEAGNVEVNPPPQAETAATAAVDTPMDATDAVIEPLTDPMVTDDVPVATEETVGAPPAAVEGSVPEPAPTTTTTADESAVAADSDAPKKEEEESSTMVMLQTINQRTFKPGETFSLTPPDNFNLGASGVDVDSAFGISMRRKLKFQSHVTSGLTKNDEKKVRVEVFWGQTWPKLESIGWTRFYGLGPFAGAMRFFKPTGRKDYRAAKGVDYFDRIRDVLDYIYSVKEGKESEVAEEYEAAIDSAMEKIEKSKAPPPKKRRRRKSNPSSTDEVVPPRERKRRVASIAAPLDMSWKQGGKNYPKKTSKIGEDYQVVDIPDAGSFKPGEVEESSTEEKVLWDPEKASEKLKDFEELMKQVPSNKKLQFLVAVSERDYNPENVLELSESIKYDDGTDWDEAKRLEFRDEIFKLRKDLTGVCSAMNIDMKTCLAYYLGKFKRSLDYRLLKTVCNESRQVVEDKAEHETDACAICGDGGNLLICDGCEGEYHMTCQKPSLKEIPEGDWECDDCVNRKFLAAREFLIRRSKLFEVDPDPKSNPGPDMLAYRPSPTILEAVGRMAKVVADEMSRPLSQKEDYNSV